MHTLSVAKCAELLGKRMEPPPPATSPFDGFAVRGDESHGWIGDC